MKIQRMFPALALSMLSLCAHAEESDTCKELCTANKSECRTQAERASQKDADLPGWAKRDRKAPWIFSGHTTPQGTSIPEIREDNYRKRRGEMLSLCEDKHVKCTKSCVKNNQRDSIFR
jgi:hypothetical protein